MNDRNKRLILICSIGLLIIGVFLFVKGNTGNGSNEKSTSVVNEIETGKEKTYAATESAIGEEEEGEPDTDSRTSEKKKEKGKEENGKEENETKKKSSHQKASSNKTDEADTGNNSKSEKKKAANVGETKTESKNNKKPDPTAASQSAEPVSQTATPEPEEEKRSECTLTVTCQQVFSHMDKLSESAKKVVPADGMILQGNYSIQKGDTVFDVLKRACAEKSVLLDYVYTPVYSTYYIRGIHNLYEFDCGDESGWMYSVNGTVPNYGCSQYELSKGDNIIFYYTCER